MLKLTSNDKSFGGGASSDSSTNGGERKGHPLRDGKAQKTPLPSGRRRRRREGRRKLVAQCALPLGFSKEAREAFWTGATKVGRRCSSPSWGATASWSKCCLLQVPGAQTFPTPLPSSTLSVAHLCGRRQPQREEQRRLVAQSCPPTWGPQRGTGRPLGSGGAQVRRRCMRPP